MEISRALGAVGLGLWLGGGVGTALSTRAIFKHARGQPLAGQIAADALRSLAWLTWLSVVLVLAADALGMRGAPSWLSGCSTGLFLVGELAIKPMIRELRAAAGGSAESLGADDPRRKQFGKLHGISMLLLVGQLACALAALVLLTL
jgi:hypothetical protein